MSELFNSERDRCLSDLSWNLGVAIGMPPIDSTAVCEHVFQVLVDQFYRTGVAYFPNFGWLHYIDGKAMFTPCGAMVETLEKIADSLKSKQYSFAGLEIGFHEK